MLDVAGLTSGYGGPPVLHDIDLTVGESEWVTLLGANAAGKTTLLKTLIGVLPAASGAVRLNGREIQALPPEERLRLGLAIVPEGRRVFTRMTVQENLQMGAHLFGGGRAEDFDRVYSLFPRMAERRRQKAGTLSGGEQQMLALGRALMSRPRLILLDEPSMGLAPKLVAEVFALLRGILTEGVSILLVEQNAKMALKSSARAYVLRLGRMVLSGSSADLAENPEVRQAYLGG
ncbi:MAG: ABC transporter ATP-binding protein [Candidatus Lindowbacteria bacterium RIFCSPLOWO2_12_FULL_62_27]|nr:MAG: ABC transporter ATP-binding protein [Candidatus Lindowbacteria bacterium RIFCSPLOWO2_02_FULL_62_12]OGH60737.1 MAG: ABC transporter ATP-binding protein [Candidatus Lindowbacteria bacterium RIFCSPLOWO2_12_FULL_62_27]